MAQDYRELIVWQKAIELTVLVYKITQSFPQSELYGLSSQMRRASVSVASNIAEGRGRINSMEFRQFLGVARGSTCELLTQIHVARALGFSTGGNLDEAESLGTEISKMLLRFIQTLESRKIAGKNTGARCAAFIAPGARSTDGWRKQGEF
ncbi:four helix bundle protein [Occallatibacter savannae]|uniref:four helix bundle protein n=1 Tax=Occallatibacter savannae TaxID=1002691 RepID=UPI000D690CFC|nr:four helix bundle protein [Occallatibacter savannae]